MAKQKPQAALFDMLRTDRGREAPAPSKPAPVIRKTLSAAGVDVPVPKQEHHAAAAPKPRVAGGPLRIAVTYNQLIIAGVAVLCMVALAFVAGMRMAPSAPAPLPPTQKEPSFNTVQGGSVTPGLVPRSGQPTGERPVVPEMPRTPEKASGVLPPTKGGPAGKSSLPEKAPAPEKPAVAEKSPAPEKGPVTTETPVTGPQWHVQVQQFPVSESRAIDLLRAYLSNKGVETDLVKVGGGYILYGHDRFTERKKSDDSAAQIKKLLAAFEKDSHIGVAKDAFSVQVKKE